MQEQRKFEIRLRLQLNFLGAMALTFLLTFGLTERCVGFQSRDERQRLAWPEPKPELGCLYAVAEKTHASLSILDLIPTLRNTQLKPRPAR